jgi:hypothetical protein
MRQRFEGEPALNVIPIEKIVLPLRSRDELAPILAGLQWIWCHPTLRPEILGLLERKIMAGLKPTGRTGMDLWQILVLGVVRLGLDANFDRLEDLSNHHALIRQMLGVPQTPWGAESQVFNHQTLRDNIALFDEALLQEINALVAAQGRAVFKKNDRAALAPLEVKVDSYVLETDVHFPTDLNLLWDAGRKCVDLLESSRDTYDLTGWRKAKDWRRRLKSLERSTSKVVFGGGKEKEKRQRQAVTEYLKVARELSGKVRETILVLYEQNVQQDRLEYFQAMLDKQIDLVDRRLLQGEVIAAGEKTHSFFEPETEWINKGKKHPSVELGHRLVIATDQHELVQGYGVPVGEVDVEQSIPMIDLILGRYGEGQIASASFDKGFTRAADRELLELFIPVVVMPKRGRKNEVEAQAERDRKFVGLRRQHSAVESDINSLEHHGLDRCLDVGLPAYLRYVGLGVLAYNLHVIGRELLARERAQAAA